MALETRTVIGSYAVEGELGRGGMGTVYRARHVEHGREVALKLLARDLRDDPDVVARFRREGRLQASLEHPHVVTVYEAGDSPHGPFLAMRLVRGTTLAALMRERGLPAARALALLDQVADALDAAHAAGLVHRDVKPQNVLVGEADDAYLGDFGLTRAGGAGGMTATGHLLGTVAYLAPEVIRGGEAVPASDRYAFAALLFECLTGTVVFPRGTEAALLFAHTSEPAPRASRRRPELPPALDDVLVRALAKDPAARPATTRGLVAEVAAALDAAGCAELGPPPPPGAAALEEHTAPPAALVAPAPAPATSDPRRRRAAAGLLAAAAAGAAVALGAAALLGGDDGDAAAAPPPPLAGSTLLGSTLEAPGRALDCRGRAPGAGSPGCTIAQAALPGRTLVVPEDGVVRRWSVRSARGELGLAVLRTRGGDTFQIARSRNEFAGNDGVHVFATDLAVERGDQVALVVLPGAAAGVRPAADGAEATRFFPTANLGKPVRSGFAHELLLRVDFERGGQQRLPRQVTGAAAAGLPPGRVVARRRVRPPRGGPVEIRLVALGDRFALDRLRAGRRTARLDVPADMRPGEGRVVKLEVLPDPSAAGAVGVYLEWVRTGSARILSHAVAAFPGEFEFVN